MSELELLISRYLDGELDIAQARRLRELLAESPEARATLREMRAISRTARQTPATHVPARTTEHRLFARLSREGYAGAGTLRNPAPPAPAAAQVWAVRRAVPAATMAVLAILAALWMLPQDGPLPVQRSIAIRSDGSATAASTARETRAPSIAASSDARRAESAPVVRASRIAAPGSTSGSVTPGPALRDADGLVDARTLTPAAPRELVLSDGSRTADQDGTVLLRGADGSRESDPPVTTDRGDGSARDLAESQPPAPRDLPIVPPPERARFDEPRMSASFSAGALVVDRGRQTAEALTIGLDVDLFDGHRFSVLGGRSVAVTERRATNTLAVVSRSANDDKAGGGLMQVDDNPSPYDIAVRQEWWLGLGYGARVLRTGPVDIGVGIRAGVGEQAWRIGGELPISVRLGRDLSLSTSVLLTHVRPHDRDRNAFGIESRENGYLYEAEAGPTTFTTLGAEIGLRIALD